MFEMSNMKTEQEEVSEENFVAPCITFFFPFYNKSDKKSICSAEMGMNMRLEFRWRGGGEQRANKNKKMKIRKILSVSLWKSLNPQKDEEKKQQFKWETSGEMISAAWH